MFRVLITGSRTWRWPATVCAVLDELFAEHGYDLTIVHGACPRGPDDIADQWCRRTGVAVERFPADWSAFGRRAGFVRNSTMADSRPDLCVAFIFNGSAGASGCADMAERRGVTTWRDERWSA